MTQPAPGPAPALSSPPELSAAVPAQLAPAADEDGEWARLRREAAALVWMAGSRGTTPVGLLQAYVAYLKSGGEPPGAPSA